MVREKKSTWWHIKHARNIVKWNIHRWDFKSWRIKYEYYIDEYNDWRRERNKDIFISPEWLCFFSGHHTGDCNNHSTLKPEHDFCYWCEKDLPFTAVLPQPISYRRRNG